MNALPIYLGAMVALLTILGTTYRPPTPPTQGA